jgi:hypothetical protein
MYSFAETVIGFFSPVRWNESEDRLAFDCSASESRSALFGYEARSISVMGVDALIHEYAPSVLEETGHLLAATQVVSGFVAVACMAFLGLTMTSRGSS